MSTVVVLTASAADNLDGTTGLIPAGSLEWQDSTNALANDALSSYVTFDGTNTKSEFLYVHDFGASLPTELAVEGIQVKVIRTGAGNTEDFYVGLVYNNGVSLTVTSPGKQKAGLWEADTDDTANYGSASDSWNKIWTAEEINNTDFGFGISAESPDLNDSGAVNFVQMTISYHQDIDIDPTGGLSGSGTAVVQFTSNNIPMSGGGIGGGHGGILFPTDVADGGITVGGAADPIHSFIQPVGGCTITGSGNQSQVFTAPDWVVHLNPEEVVPPNVTDATGIAEIWLRDDGDDLASVIWRVYYENISSTDFLPEKAHIKEGPPGVDGPVIVNLRFYSEDFDSPIIGHLGGFEHPEQAAIYQGDWYVQLNSNEFPFGEIRAQIWRDGILGGGTAGVTFFDQGEISGGAVASGESENQASIQGLGGAAVSPVSGEQFTSNLDTTGGIIGSGDGFVNPYIGLGGAKPGGTSDVQFTSANIDVSGGLEANGEAFVERFLPTTGGSTAAGESLNYRLIIGESGGGANAGGIALVFPHVSEGGAAVGGVAIVDPHIGIGGSVVGGAAVQTQYFDTNLQANEFEVIASGDQVVPPNATTQKAVAKFFVNPATNRLHWYITHNFGTQMDAVRLRGPANKGETASTIISIDFLQSVDVSPIEGSTTILPSQVTQIQNEQWYLFMRNNSGTEVMRAQIELITGVKGGGEVPQLYEQFPAGGTTCSGGADIGFVFNPDVESEGGGVIFVGNTLISFQVFVGGGIVVNGSSDLTTDANPTSVGGVVCNGEAIEDSIWNNIASGGVVCSGPKGIIAIGPKVGGGATAGEEAGILFLYNIAPFGGAIVNGAARQTFYDQFISIGAVRVGGNSIGDKIKFYIKGIKNGRELTRASDNILNAPEEEDKLISPTEDVSPELKDDRFRIQHNPGWCYVEEACEEGALAKIIIDRQKGIVPPKLRKNTRRDRRIATAL